MCMGAQDGRLGLRAGDSVEGRADRGAESRDRLERRRNGRRGERNVGRDPCGGTTSRSDRAGEMGGAECPRSGERIAFLRRVDEHDDV